MGKMRTDPSVACPLIGEHEEYAEVCGRTVEPFCLSVMVDGIQQVARSLSQMQSLAFLLATNKWFNYDQ